MNTTLTEENGNVTSPAGSEQSNAASKPARSRRRAPPAPKKAKVGKTATPGKKPPKGTTKAKGGKTDGAAREGSKTAKVLDLLKRKGGVTAKELLKVTGWQPHSLRGFLSGTVGKKMGLTLVSAKGGDGERTYSIES